MAVLLPVRKNVYSWISCGYTGWIAKNWAISGNLPPSTWNVLSLAGRPHITLSLRLRQYLHGLLSGGFPIRGLQQSPWIIVVLEVSPMFPGPSLYHPGIPLQLLPELVDRDLPSRSTEPHFLFLSVFETKHVSASGSTLRSRFTVEVGTQWGTFDLRDLWILWELLPGTRSLSSS
jgi:hypothetical protein